MPSRPRPLARPRAAYLMPGIEPDTVAPASHGKPTLKPRRDRIVRRDYGLPPTEAISALTAYFNEAVAYHQPPYTAPVPNPRLLLTGAIWGPVTYARHSEDGSEVGLPDGGAVVGFAFDYGRPRFIVPAGFFLLRVLTLFATRRYEAQAVHGVEVLASGFKLTRLMANADEGEEVRLLSRHTDLRPWSLEIVPGLPRHDRQRSDAVRVALDFHRDAGGSGLLSAQAYAVLLKGAFRLFDAEYGTHFLRKL